MTRQSAIMAVALKFYGVALVIYGITMIVNVFGLMYFTWDNHWLANSAIYGTVTADWLIWAYVGSYAIFAPLYFKITVGKVGLPSWLVVIANSLVGIGWWQMEMGKLPLEMILVFYLLLTLLNAFWAIGIYVLPLPTPAPDFK